MAIASLLRIDAAGTRHADPDHRPQVVLPGSFNPLHDGHWGLARAAAEILGDMPAFELSRRNVDKPDLTDADVLRRSCQFEGRGELWVTHAPRFFEKAALFPGATFAVGADTAARIVDARYHGNDADDLAAAMERIAEQECRFLVAGRVNAEGVVLTLNDLAIPIHWRRLFQEIPTTLFRLDIRSTDLRRRGGEP